LKVKVCKHVFGFISNCGCVGVISLPADTWGETGVVLQLTRERDSFDFVGYHGLGLILIGSSFLKNR